jgi:uroporphyrinogen decarboxylase
MDSNQPLLSTLSGSKLGKTPIWLMRQAGRYLPEYRSLRAKSESFMEFCRNPAVCCEATLQPIKRFGFDAAIIFSDILVIPDALGQKVSFESGTGPKLEPLDHVSILRGLDEEVDLAKLSATFEAISLVRAKLPVETSLIGFCGAPWTVASYMIAGHGTPDQAPARLFAYKFPSAFQSLITLLVDSSIAYLDQQIKAGADVVQIFDSWAGVLPDDEFNAWCFAPTMEIVHRIKALHPSVKIIVFPRGSGVRLESYASDGRIDCVGIDTAADLEWVRSNVQDKVCVQGNLDPIVLLAGGNRMQRAIDRILAHWNGRPFIFNLGHGILPNTPIAHVEDMISYIRQVSKN